MSKTALSPGIILRLLVGILLLAGIFHFKANLHGTIRAIAHARVLPLLAGLCTAIFTEFLTAVKWHWLLLSVGARCNLLQIVRASFIGIFYNNFLPGSVGGDVAKMLLIAPRAGGKAVTLASIFIQRNTGLAALLVVGNIVLWVFPVKLSLFSSSLAFANDLRFWFAALAAGYLMINLVLFSGTIANWINRRSELIQVKHSGSKSIFLRKMAQASASITRLHAAIVLFRGKMFPAFAISIVTQLLDCFTIYCAGRALMLGLPFWSYCVFVPCVNVAALIPISFNGIGLREAVYVLLLQVFHISASNAVGLSLIHFGYLISLGVSGAIMHTFWFDKNNSTSRRSG